MFGYSNLEILSDIEEYYYTFGDSDHLAKSHFQKYYEHFSIYLEKKNYKDDVSRLLKTGDQAKNLNMKLFEFKVELSQVAESQKSININSKLSQQSPYNSSNAYIIDKKLNEKIYSQQDQIPEENISIQFNNSIQEVNNLLDKMKLYSSTSKSKGNIIEIKNTSNF